MGHTQQAVQSSNVIGTDGTLSPLPLPAPN